MLLELTPSYSMCHLSTRGACLEAYWWLGSVQGACCCVKALLYWWPQLPVDVCTPWSVMFVIGTRLTHMCLQNLCRGLGHARCGWAVCLPSVPRLKLVTVLYFGSTMWCLFITIVTKIIHHLYVAIKLGQVLTQPPFSLHEMRSFEEVDEFCGRCTHSHASCWGSTNTGWMHARWQASHDHEPRSSTSPELTLRDLNELGWKPHHS